MIIFFNNQMLHLNIVTWTGVHTGVYFQVPSNRETPLTRAALWWNGTNPVVCPAWRRSPVGGAPCSLQRRSQQHAGWRVWRQPPNTSVSCGRSRAQTLTVLDRPSGRFDGFPGLAQWKQQDSRCPSCWGSTISWHSYQVSNCSVTPGDCSKLYRTCIHYRTTSRLSLANIKSELIHSMDAGVRTFKVS